ncbi:MAG: DUF2807 domain-containing protein, partial [Lentimicrobiaceae bacterium]|nr:DUF2807 domain-containing protein [Lentimicrobiaceae bacterium]
NVKLRANLKAEMLETIDASGAAGINIFGEFNSDTEIDLSGASHLDGYWCEGKNTEISLSGASKIKNFSFFGEYMKVELSGASQMDVKNSELNRCKVNVSGASKFNAKGFATETEFTGSGASYFYTFDLESDNLNIDLSGASNGEVTVNHKIKGNLSGASILKYKRAENIWDVNITGGSKIIKVD